MGTILTEPSWTLAEALGNLKGKERFLLCRVGQKKEEGKRRGEEVGWGLQPCREMKVRRCLHIQGIPSLGELNLDRRASFSVGREHGKQCVAAGQRETCTQGSDPSPAHPALAACPAMQTRAGCWNVGFGEQTQAEDCGVLWGDILRGRERGRRSINRMLVEEAWTTTEKVSLLSDAQRMSQLHPLSLMPAPAIQGLWRTLHSLGSFEPPAMASPIDLLHNQQNPELWGSLRRRHLWVGHMHRWSRKHRWMPAIKKKSWKLSLQQHKPRYYTHDQLCNLSPYRASEPTTKGSLIHGRYSFSSCRLCGLLSKGAGPGQSLSFSIALQRVQLHAECNPRTWLHWMHAGDLVKTTAERHQGRVPSCPWLRWGQEQC